MRSSSSSPNDILGRIKGKFFKSGLSLRRAWPQLVFNLVRPIPSLPIGRRALLIGINYSDTLWGKDHSLADPQGDVVLMKKHLIEHGKWSEDEIVVLTDAKGTSDRYLPTFDNITRELKDISESNFQSVFFLYTGHSGQQPQPRRPRPPRSHRDGAPGRIEEEENDQFIIPIDAVVGCSLKDIDRNRIVLDDDLHDCLIANLQEGATFLAVLDTCHSATLLDLKHFRCNRTHGIRTNMKRGLRKVLVEPLWLAFGAANGDITKVDSFNMTQICNGLCPRRKKAICPIAVSISACKDNQQVYECGPSLTQTIVRLLSTELRLNTLLLRKFIHNSGSKPSTSLRDIIGEVLKNYKALQRQMKDAERYYKSIGDEKKRKEIAMKRREAKRLMPQLSSSGALNFRQLRGRWSTLTDNPRTYG